MKSFSSSMPLLHTSQIGRQASMRGDLSMKESLLIEGSFSGSLRSSSHITIARTAVVENAKISARSACVLGKLSGALSTRLFIDIQPKANVSADIETQTLTVSEKCRFEGSIRMPGIGD
jgi:cytoskeletal protein CcmA (bactofilin family)